MDRVVRSSLVDTADSLGLSPEVLCVRLANKAGIEKRVIVRSKSGGLRIVQPGARLNLAADEFIANVPMRMRRHAIAASAQRTISRDDLD